MTYEEAIKQLNSVTIYHDGKCTRTAINLAIEALEKQIPKKPVRDKDWYFSLLCPCCNRKIADTEHMWEKQKVYLIEQGTRCPCGQAIDWSDDE